MRDWLAVLAAGAVLLGGCGAAKAVTSSPNGQARKVTAPTKAHRVPKESDPAALLAELATGSRAATGQPVHIDLTLTDSLGNISSSEQLALDPVDQEDRIMVIEHVSGVSGGPSTTLTAESIVIKGHDWTRSTPPGGGWHESTLPPTQTPFPIAELEPYLVDVAPVAGRIIRGHATEGLTATVDAKGMRLLEQSVATRPITAANQIVESARLTIWFSPTPEYLPRAMNLVEDCVQDGQAYQVNETLEWFDYGQAVHLSAP